MTPRQFCSIGAAIALIAACSEAPEPASEEPVAIGDADATAGQTVNLADYGFLDGGEISPIDTPEWMPEDLALPSDFVPVEERAIGTRTFLLRGVTQQPSEGLFENLSAGLRDAGYEVREGDGYRADNLVYFSGKGYEDSTIKIVRGESDTLLEISLGKVN